MRNNRPSFSRNLGKPKQPSITSSKDNSDLLEKVQPFADLFVMVESSVGIVLLSCRHHFGLWQWETVEAAVQSEHGSITLPKLSRGVHVMAEILGDHADEPVLLLENVDQSQAILRRGDTRNIVRVDVLMATRGSSAAIKARFSPRRIVNRSPACVSWR